MALDKKSEEKPTNPADKYKDFLAKMLCTFRTAGRRCQILGAHVDSGSEYRLCDWHWLCQSTPNLLQDREEFIAYRDRDRQTYPKDWLSASLYVDDEIVWSCTLGKEQRREFVRALRVVENECDEYVFGKSEDRGKVFDDTPTPETSVQEYVANLPF